MRKSWWILALFVVGCQKQAARMPAPEPPVVLVAPPVKMNTRDYKYLTGRTEAVEQVEVRTRVSGYLTKIVFEAGKEVKKGDLLFEIDKRPYQAALDKAEADIKLADAKIKQAEAEVARNKPLVATGATTQSEFDRFVADRDVAIAQREAYRAQAQANRLNVEFCTITSPIQGRISRNFITEGNLVAADQTLLTTIVSVDPMYVYFDLDTPTLLKVQEALREGKLPRHKTPSEIEIGIGLETEPGRYPHPASIDFFDNRIDPGTSTLRCRALLPNPLINNLDRVFTSGLFVRVQLPIGPEHPSILVSERAIGTKQDLKFVLTVNEANEVVEKPVKLGSVQDGMQVIREGLKGDERVIVTGLQRVRPGIKVTPKLASEFAAIDAGQAKPVAPTDAAAPAKK